MSQPRTVTSFIGNFLKPEMWHVYNQVTGLKGFRSVVLTRERQNPDMFPFEEVHLIRGGKLSLWRRGVFKYLRHEPPAVYRGAIPGLIDQLHEFGTDVLHIYFGHEATRLAPLFDHFDRPIVVSFHGADLGIYVRRPGDIEHLPKVFSKARLILVRCEHFIEHLVELGCPPGKIRLNRTHVRQDVFRHIEREPAPGGEWRLLQACRLLPKKGILDSIRALARFVREFPRATLTVAGEGPELPELQREVWRHRLHRNVFFTGLLRREELFELHQQSHFFLHPSLAASDNDIEGIPNSLLEAMATGLVCASSTHAGIPEAIRDGVDGLLVPPGQPERLAEALLGVARDPERYRKLARAAVARIRDEFSRERQIAALESLYEEAMQPPAPAPVP